MDEAHLFPEAGPLPDAGSLAELLRSWCLSIAPRGEASSFEIFAFVDGEEAALRSDASADEPWRQYDGGCLQDMLLAVLVAQLADERVLDPAERIGAYLPDLMRGSRPGAAIRVGDLVCHACGYWPPPGGTPGEAAAPSWSELCDFLTASEPVFPPGQVASYHMLERWLLLALLLRVTGKSAYRHMEERILGSPARGRFAPSGRYGALGVEDLLIDVVSLGRLTGELLSDAPAWTSRLFAPPSIGCAPISRHPCPEKSFVPMRFAWGTMSFANHLWGQNGMSPEGSMTAVRFDDQGDALLAGRFPTRVERDVILNYICHELGFARASGDSPRSPIVGTLGGIDPGEVVGRYEGAGGGALDVTLEGGQIVIAAPDAGKIQCAIDEQGRLQSRFAWPALWIEAFAHPTTSKTCLMLGQAAYVKRT